MWQFITEYWAGWLCALIGGAILAAIPKIKALWDAVLALLHDRIYTECYRFMELGYITRDGLRNLNYLYKTYQVSGRQLRLLHSGNACLCYGRQVAGCPQG